MSQGSESGEWEDRVLCLDDACIGVVSRDGRCQVCGKPGPADRSPASFDADLTGSAAPIGSVSTTETVMGAVPFAPDTDDSDGVHAPDDFADRRLCPDGACTGVLDRTGRCPLCGCVETPAS